MPHENYIHATLHRTRHSTHPMSIERRIKLRDFIKLKEIKWKRNNDRTKDRRLQIHKYNKETTKWQK